MWKYIKKRWRGNLLAVILLCSYVTCTFLETFLLMDILDMMTNHAQWHMLEGKVFTFIIILALSVAAYYAGSVTRARVHVAMRDDMRTSLNKQIGAYTYQKFRNKNIADYIAWYSTNIEQISTLGFSSFFSICTTIFQTVIAVISLGMIYWKMSIYSFVFIVILYFLSVCTKKYIIRKSKERVESNEVFLAKLNDLLQGFSVLYCFKKMPLFEYKMHDASTYYEQKNYDNTLAQIRVNALLLSVNIIFQSTFLIIAIWCVLHNFMKASAIIGIYSFLPKVFDGITDTVQLKKTMISTKPYFDQMEAHDVMKPIHLIDESINTIELKDVSYAYDQKQVFVHMNYQFLKGKKYAVVGKSGCGKSTLLKIIAGLLSDYSGAIVINGRQVDHNTSILSQIAYIDQQPILFDGTVLENISLWNSPDQNLIPSVLEDSGLKDINHIFSDGLDTIICEGGKNLSGGQKQRIAIARALYAKKQFLFIDEGTSALDKPTRTMIENKLLERKDLTIIMISHHLNQEEQGRLDGIIHM